MQEPELTAVEKLLEMGFNSDIAEALHENGVTPERAKEMSEDEIFDMWLEWEGILGYGNQIRRNLSNVKMVRGAEVVR